jgi:hypothetical protein
MKKRDLFASIPPRFMLIAQLAGGLASVALVAYVATNLKPYVSSWDEESDTFYEAALQALRLYHLNPTAPTAFIFWDRSLPETGPAIRAFSSSPSSLRIYGVHISTDKKMEVRKDWLQYAPHRATLLIDRQQLLQTAFHARALPMVYILLPKQKKIYSYLGNINDSRQRMLEIISSE